MELPADTRSITLEHMRAFIAVAHCRSFQKAGEQLCRSQSAVTQSVKRLEAHLNCTLVERQRAHLWPYHGWATPAAGTGGYSAAL